jgi:TrmH family RNA methyltransferase
MLTRSQEKLIRSLKTKKGRQESGRCLVEGSKLIKEAGRFVDFQFGPEDTKEFAKLVSTETPQPVAAVAQIPEWDWPNLDERPTTVVLDNVQDPGNVGTIMRLCLGFNAGLVLVESADPSAPKVIRASAGAIFKLPWISVSRTEAEVQLDGDERPLFRLEKRPQGKDLRALVKPRQAILVAGSEGQGISLRVSGTSVAIKHESRLESLNVAAALAIALHARYH